MNPDKLWAINQKNIENSCPRYTCLCGDEFYQIYVTNYESFSHILPYVKTVLKYNKKPEFGNKIIEYSDKLLLEVNDCKDLCIGEEVTLINLGNVIVEKIDHDAQSMLIRFELKNNIKNTKKLTWLSNYTDISEGMINIYDNLLTKNKLKDCEDFKDFINPNTIKTINIIVSEDVKNNIKKGDIIQFIRKGQYICDDNLKFSIKS
jgi:glutamyl-tRNA synthetase